MAFGMKHWLGLLAVGLVLVAIWRLPPSAFEPADRIELSHEEVRYRALSNELRVTEATLKRIRWADSLSALVVSDGLEDVAFTLPTGLDLTPEELVEAEARVAIDSWGITRQPNMALGFVYQPVSHGAESGVGEDRRSRNETYVGTRDGVDYCFRVRVTEADRITQNVRYDMGLRNSRWMSNHLGPCLFYAQYGMPGTGIARWLESGGIQYGLGRAIRTEEDVRQYGRSGLFGLTYFSARDGVVADRCQSGLPEACAAIFLQPDGASGTLAAEVAVARQSPAISTVDRRSVFGGESAFLLADLEREFGTERFAQFWRSEAPVDEAFVTAFGLEAGPWVVRWLESFMHVDAPGPQFADSTSSLGFLTLGFFVFVAFLRNRERTVV